MIPVDMPAFIGNEKANIDKVLKTRKLLGGEFTEKCTKILEELTGCRRVMLVPSFGHALEMCAALLGIGPGDEVLMPSYSSHTAANAFLLRGAKVVFVDITPGCMNIDEGLLEQAVNEKTRAIVPLHYAGSACSMEAILHTAETHNLYVVENGEHALLGKYRDQSLGTLGNFGCFSFQDSNIFSCGEGGALFINDPHFIEKAERIRNEGMAVRQGSGNTENNSEEITEKASGKFEEKTAEESAREAEGKLSWVEVGSSYAFSELHGACLYSQLAKAKDILHDRLKNWDQYYRKLKPLEQAGLIQLPRPAEEAAHNGSIFYIKLKDREDRNSLIKYLKYYKIESAAHYEPLHSSPAGKKYCTFWGKDRYTTSESERLLRLPLHYGLSSSHVNFICSTISTYYNYSALKESAAKSRDFKAG